jgi:hypothetical protein
MAKVLYIAGYGRSGSTVLDVILGAHAKITSIGEATYLLNDWLTSNRYCSCGELYSNCAFWKGLFHGTHPPIETARLVRRMERWSFLPRLLLDLVPEGDKRAYKEFQERFFSHIVSATGKPIVADSSKSAQGAVGRLLALKRIAGHDVYVIHLVRNGFAAMESLLLRGSNWSLEGYTGNRKRPALWYTMGWLHANLWSSLLGRTLGHERYLMIRYEDLMREPASVLRKVAAFAGFDPRELIERVLRNDAFHVGHLVGGNRVRLQREIRLKRTSSESPGMKLKPFHRLTFALVAGWLNRLYGYDG